ncbi:MAG: NUDIX hydrolase [Pseudomonadales bacterium]|nr:NUDIX domain-containing protein [Pseudomonadota bacterium]
MREVAHCYVVVAGRVLLLERAAGLRGAGFWAPPGGHLETGESPLEAVCRECAEELGLALPQERLVLLRRAPFRERRGAGVNWLFSLTVATPPPFFPAADAARMAAFFPLRLWPRPLLPWTQDDLLALSAAGPPGADGLLQ